MGRRRGMRRDNTYWNVSRSNEETLDLHLGQLWRKSEQGHEQIGKHKMGTRHRAHHLRHGWLFGKMVVQKAECATNDRARSTQVACTLTVGLVEMENWTSRPAYHARARMCRRVVESWPCLWYSNQTGPLHSWRCWMTSMQIEVKFE